MSHCGVQFSWVVPMLDLHRGYFTQKNSQEGSRVEMDKKCTVYPVPWLKKNSIVRPKGRKRVANYDPLMGNKRSDRIDIDEVIVTILIYTLKTFFFSPMVVLNYQVSTFHCYSTAFPAAFLSTSSSHLQLNARL
jgi:hypothetical protein